MNIFNYEYIQHQIRLGLNSSEGLRIAYLNRKMEKIYMMLSCPLVQNVSAKFKNLLQ